MAHCLPVLPLCNLRGAVVNLMQSVGSISLVPGLEAVPTQLLLAPLEALERVRGFGINQKGLLQVVCLNLWVLVPDAQAMTQQRWTSMGADSLPKPWFDKANVPLRVQRVSASTTEAVQKSRVVGGPLRYRQVD